MLASWRTGRKRSQGLLTAYRQALLQRPASTRQEASIRCEIRPIVEYSQDDDGSRYPISETRVPVAEIVGLPEAGTSGHKALEIRLSRLIDALEQSMDEDQE